MLEQFYKNNMKIAKIYHCPHHPEITVHSNCKNPSPGMILEVIEEFNLNAVNSVLIGDKKSDKLAGINTGLGKNIYIEDLL